jgi:3-phenylpropionate/trans-cinnamate dioxygenase ferredoxin reductase component
MSGKQVVMAFPGTGIGSRLFPPDLVTFLTDFYCQKGVEVWAGSRAVGIEPRRGRLGLNVQETRLVNVRKIMADGVVAGIGIEPNVALARQPG